jgi:hypothetical protein
MVCSKASSSLAVLLRVFYRTVRLEDWIADDMNGQILIASITRSLF